MLFVSHATKDDTLVDKLTADLTAAGLTDDLWVDHHDGIGTGDEWQRSIQNAINDCDAGIFVLTPASAHSRFCEAEWTRLLQLKKRLYIALLEPVPLADFPVRLSIIQYADFTKDSKDGLRVLMKALGGRVVVASAEPAGTKSKRFTADNFDLLLRIPMYGRDTDLAIAASKIKEAPLFIVGIGGLGKSRLAFALGEQFDWNGVVWHRVSDTSTSEEVLLLLRQHLDLETDANENAVLNAVRTNGRLLIVIDNADSVANSARPGYINLINALHYSSAAVCVTSRELWRDKKLMAKQPHDLKALSPEDATAIVSKLSRLLGIDVDTSAYDSDLASAARYHPRLIELAVSKLEYMIAPDVINELRALRSIDSEKALTEMIGVTVDQMTERYGYTPLNALCRLAICRGGFTAKAGQSILKANDEEFHAVIRILIDYRFVRLQNARYSINDLVQQVIDEDNTALDDHYYFYATLAQQLEKSTAPLKYAQMDIERENFEVAFSFSLERNWDAAFALANACHEYMANRGLWEQRSNWYKRLEERLSQENNALKLASFRLNYAAVLASYPFGRNSDNIVRAISLLKDALEYFFFVKDVDSMISCHANLGTAYSTLAQFNDPETNLMSALLQHGQEERLIRQNKFPKDQLARSLLRLAGVYIRIAQYKARSTNLERARNILLEVLREHRSILDWNARQSLYTSLGNSLRNLTTGSNATSNRMRAIIYYKSALSEISPEIDAVAYAGIHINLVVHQEGS